MIHTDILFEDAIIAALQRSAAPYIGAPPVFASNLTPGAQPSPSQVHAVSIFELEEMMMTACTLQRFPDHSWECSDLGILTLNVTERSMQPLIDLRITIDKDGNLVQT